MSDCLIQKLKSAIKNGTEVTLTLTFIKFERNSNDAINVLDSLLLTYIYVSKVRKDFENDSSANIKFSKTQLSKMIE